MFCPRCGAWAQGEIVACHLCGHGRDPDAVPSRVASERPLASVVAPVAYGGFWRRLVAACVDALVLFFPAATLRLLLNLDPFGFNPRSPVSFVAMGGELLLDWLYAALLIGSSTRATLGQRIMGLEVTSVGGERVSFARASWRYFAQMFTVLTFGVGHLMQLFTPRRQTLHDLLSGTVVVRTRTEPAATPVPVMRDVP